MVNLHAPEVAAAHGLYDLPPTRRVLFEDTGAVALFTYADEALARLSPQSAEALSRAMREAPPGSVLYLVWWGVEGQSIPRIFPGSIVTLSKRAAGEA